MQKVVKFHEKKSIDIFWIFFYTWNLIMLLLSKSEIHSVSERSSLVLTLFFHRFFWVLDKILKESLYKVLQQLGNQGFYGNFENVSDFRSLYLHDYLSVFNFLGYKINLLDEISRLRYVLSQFGSTQGSYQADEQPHKLVFLCPGYALPYNI